MTEDEVFLTSGGSGALIFSCLSMLDKGDNILMSRPGFPLIKAVCKFLEIEVRLYETLADKDWECDIDSISS